MIEYIILCARLVFLRLERKRIIEGAFNILRRYEFFGMKPLVRGVEIKGVMK